MEGLHFVVGLLPGALLGAKALAGFPSLKTLPFGAQLAFQGVTVFQQDSRNESMVVTLTDFHERALASFAQTKLGKAVYVGYPFLQEAKVVKVTDELFSYTLAADGSTQVVQTPNGPDDIVQFQRKSSKIEDQYSKKLAIMTGAIESLIHVDMLRGVIKTDEGAVVKDYGEIPGFETTYAPQTIVDDVYSKDPRFIERAALPIEEEFPLESRAFFLGEYAYGRPLQVLQHENGKLHVWVSVLPHREPEFGRQIVMAAESQSSYVPGFALAKNLHLHPLALSKLTSSLSVNSSGLTLNLGLNLKFEARKLKVLGYTRKGQSGWEYSPKAVELIQQYMIRFPEFIAGISEKPKGDIYNDTDFYQPPELAKEKMKEIGNWLKETQSKSFERVPLEAEQLDSDVVERIQAAAEQNLSISQPEFKLVKNIPRNALLNPVDAEQRIGNQRFVLGDRVVYVLNSGRVPIAQRGTVVGITRFSRQTWLDVAFDTTYMGGTTLGDRCKPFSGSTVPSNSVLNITDKQVVAMSAASSARKPQPVVSPLEQRAYGAPTGPQLRPAGAPPPLHGSFAGSVTGRGAPLAGQGRGMQAPVHYSQRGSPAYQRGGRAGFTNHASPSAQSNGYANGANGTPRGRGGFDRPPRGRGEFNGAPRGGRGGRGGFPPSGEGTSSGDRGRGGFKPRGRGSGDGTPETAAGPDGPDRGQRLRGRGGGPSTDSSPAARGGRGGRGRGRGRGGEVGVQG